MTNKQIIERLKEAGHEVTGSPNRAALEALAAEKGVSLEADSNSVDNAAAEVPDGDAERNRLVTPSMAVVAMCGEGSAPVLPDAGEPSTGE